MTTKHLPGPWHVGMQPGPMVYGPKGEQVADCRNVFAPPNEDGHNARLIAAAPELLEALKAVLPYAELVGVLGVLGGRPGVHVPGIHQARDAITKAEGTQ